MPSSELKGRYSSVCSDAAAASFSSLGSSRSSISPVAMSTIILARWAKSRGRFLRGALSVMHWKMAAFGDTFNPSQDRSFFKLTHYRRLLSLLRSPSDPDWSAFRSQWRHYRFHVRRESHSKFMIESMSHASDGSRMQFHLKRSCSRTQPSTSATCYGATCLATSCPCGPRRRCRSIRWDCGP